MNFCIFFLFQYFKDPLNVNMNTVGSKSETKLRIVNNWKQRNDFLWYWTCTFLGTKMTHIFHWSTCLDTTPIDLILHESQGFMQTFALFLPLVHAVIKEKLKDVPHTKKNHLKFMYIFPGSYFSHTLLLVIASAMKNFILNETRMQLFTGLRLLDTTTVQKHIQYRYYNVHQCEWKASVYYSRGSTKRHLKTFFPLEIKPVYFNKLLNVTVPFSAYSFSHETCHKH